MNYTKEELFLIWLDSFTGIEYKRKTAFYEFCRGDGTLICDPRAEDILGAENAALVKNGASRSYLEYILEGLAKKKTECVTLCSADYPPDLKNVPCPPLVLYIRGNRALLGGRKFSVVGSRKSIPLALNRAEEFSYRLAKAGFAVVTGLAEGADSAAARGALKGGRAVSVLAGGFDNVYPKCNAGLFEEIVKNGLAVSEYPPEVPTERFHFPVRNRIIAGLGEGLLVVSAGAKSGTAYTAAYADGLSKPVFALPYNVNVPSGEGCNNLIRMGAVLTQNAEDILSYFGIEEENNEKTRLTEEEKKVYDAIREEGEIHIDKLSARTGKKAFELMPVLSMLEIRKLILRQAGNTFSATGKE